MEKTLFSSWTAIILFQLTLNIRTRFQCGLNQVTTETRDAWSLLNNLNKMRGWLCNPEIHKRNQESIYKSISYGASNTAMFTLTHVSFRLYNHIKQSSDKWISVATQIILLYGESIKFLRSFYISWVQELFHIFWMCILAL